MRRAAALALAFAAAARRRSGRVPLGRRGRRGALRRALGQGDEALRRRAATIRSR